MAETFLSPVIEKLVDLLAEEVNLLKGVHKEVKGLKRELEVIQPFLRDAEVKLVKGELSDAAKAWQKQLREEADLIDDVVDEYVYSVEQHRDLSGFTGFLHKAGHSIKALKPHRDIASKIRDIKESLGETMKRGKNLGLRPYEQGARSLATSVDPTADIRMRPLYLEKEELVGIESTSKDLVKKLVEGPSSRSVIALVGEGGIGKTTLTKNVYDDDVLKEHFDCRAWITVSQTYDKEKILKTMNRLICRTKEPGGAENEAPEDLICHVKQYLKARRYVIVFDDVWQIDFWDAIKHALPCDDKGSRIIITTRYTTVADSFKETACDIVKELKSWSPEASWELFCRKAFVFESESCCPQELEEVSRKIVSKCQGLPLVIAAVGGLLSKKQRSKLEWQRVLDNLNYEFEENDKLATVSKVLLLSYYDLPYHLKACFLYFGIFPQDYEIYSKRLYRLWIAEDFIKSRGNKSLEQVAEEYLNQLVDRNLVSMEKRHCRIHDLMHDIILKMADELCFFQTLNKSESSIQEKSRRLSAYDTTKYMVENVDPSRTRSIFVHNMNELSTSVVVSLFGSCKLLRILDFENAPLYDLPKEVGNLLLLKYLSLKRTKVKRLPKSIGKLHNLQMLNVERTLVQELPVETKKLRNLRHLIASFDGKNGVRVHEGIGRLEKLQTLSLIEADSVDFIKELEMLSKLTVLRISGLTDAVGQALGASIGRMNHLERLTLYSRNDDEALDLEWSIPSCAPSLSCLSLRCRLQEFPNWILKLQNLTGLKLRHSRLIVEPLKYLNALPNLADLVMYQAYDGEELHFEEGSFQKLKELAIGNSEKLKVVYIDKGALPLLEKLDIGPFPVMENVPDIQHLTNLKYLEVTDMPKEFVAGLQPDGGSHYWKIKHVPFVQFWYEDEEGTFDVYKIGSSKLLKILQQEAS